MKLIAIMNGWRDAPHCWRMHLRRWLRFEHYYASIYSVTFFGFVFWIDTRP